MPVSLTNIGLGTAPNDDLGDKARAAFGKINLNNAALVAAVKTQAEIDAAILEQSASTGYLGQNLQTGTTYSLVLEDAGKIVEMNNAAANILTIENDVVDFPINTRIDVIQGGAGQTTIAKTGVGALLRGNKKIGGQWQVVQLWKSAALVWHVTGGVA